MVVSQATWTEVLQQYSDLSQHIKEPQNCLNFFENYKIWPFRLCYISKVTCSVLSVDALSMSSLLRDVFYIVWKHDVWRENGMACRP